MGDKTLDMPDTGDKGLDISLPQSGDDDDYLRTVKEAERTVVTELPDEGMCMLCVFMHVCACAVHPCTLFV